MHDVHGMDLLQYETGGFYILDRGYVDYDRLYNIHRKGAYFVTRGKNNFLFVRIYSQKSDKSNGVLCDQIIRLDGFYSRKAYPEKFRRIKFYDKEERRTFVFLTNNMELPAKDIALLYQYRWRVELFFKWIK